MRRHLLRGRNTLTPSATAKPPERTLFGAAGTSEKCHPAAIRSFSERSSTRVAHSEGPWPGGGLKNPRSPFPAARPGHKKRNQS
jgi:hypothetical protein